MEPTATNPQTGEKVVFRGGQWVPATGAPTPAAQPMQPRQQFPGVIQGRPKAPDPLDISRDARDQQRLDIQANTAALQGQVTALTIEEKRRKMEEDEAKRQSQTKDVEMAAEEMKNVIRAAYKAKQLSRDGWFATGFGAETVKGYGGTSAANVDALLTTIGASTAFDRLQRMRDESPTGGALGQVAVPELIMLRDSIASLKQSQSDTQFQANMDVVIDSYNRVLEKMTGERLGEGSAEEDDPEGLTATVTYEGPNPDNPAPPSGGGGDSFLGSVGDLVEGAASLPGLIANPIGQAIYNVAGYGDTEYDMGTILREGLGLPRNPDGLLRSVNTFGASALTGAGAARGIASTVQPGTAQNVLSTLGRTPIRDTAAGAGAGAGAYVGEQVGGTAGALTGAFVGGVGGYKGANALQTAGATARNAAPNALAQAAERQGVNMLPADAGGEATRILTSGARVSPLSAGPIRNAARTNQEQMRGAVNRTIGDIPETATTETAGNSVRSAATRYNEQTRETGERLYNRAYKLAGGVKSIKPVKTIAAIDEQLVRLEANPAASKSTIEELRGLRQNLQDGISIQGLRDARTTLSQGVYDGKLRSGLDQAMWKSVLGNVKDDIDAGLRSVGKADAAAAFRRADDFHSARVQHIDEVLQPLLGKGKSGEEIVTSIESMARGKQGGNARLSRLLGNMTEQEQLVVRGTVIDRMGKATPGVQDAAGDVFSASTFLTNWNKLTPQAKASLFQGKQRADLDDLALLAENMKASQQMANHSNTAMALTGGGNAIVATGLGAALHPVAAAMAAGGQVAMGKLLASPKVARLLARTAKMPPEVAARTLLEQLGRIAANDALIAADARALQQHLVQSLSQSPAPRLAASEEENPVGGEPPQ